MSSKKISKKQVSKGKKDQWSTIQNVQGKRNKRKRATDNQNEPKNLTDDLDLEKYCSLIKEMGDAENSDKLREKRSEYDKKFKSDPKLFKVVELVIWKLLLTRSDGKSNQKKREREKELQDLLKKPENPKKLENRITEFLNKYENSFDKLKKRDDEMVKMIFRYFRKLTLWEYFHDELSSDSVLSQLEKRLSFTQFYCDEKLKNEEDLVKAKNLIFGVESEKHLKKVFEYSPDLRFLLIEKLQNSSRSEIVNKIRVKDGEKVSKHCLGDAVQNLIKPGGKKYDKKSLLDKIDEPHETEIEEAKVKKEREIEEARKKKEKESKKNNKNKMNNKKIKIEKSCLVKEVRLNNLNKHFRKEGIWTKSLIKNSFDAFEQSLVEIIKSMICPGSLIKDENIKESLANRGEGILGEIQKEMKEICKGVCGVVGRNSQEKTQYFAHFLLDQARLWMPRNYSFKPKWSKDLKFNPNSSFFGPKEEILRLLNSESKESENNQSALINPSKVLKKAKELSEFLFECELILKFLKLLKHLRAQRQPYEWVHLGLDYLHDRKNWDKLAQFLKHLSAPLVQDQKNSEWLKIFLFLKKNIFQ